MNIFRCGNLFGACMWMAGLSAGCGGKDTGTETEGQNTTLASSGSSTGGEPTTGDASTGDDPTGGPTSHRICDLFLNCLAVVAPAEVPAAQQGFGSDGTCWQGTPASAEQCLMACEQGLMSWHELSPLEPACGLCQAPEDCAENEECKNGECSVRPCGDGQVAYGEVCDGPGCDADCQGPPACNPWNTAGCAEDEVCLFVFPEAACLDSDAGLPGINNACDYASHQLCAEGSTCVPPEIDSGCSPPGCCRPLCNLQTGECFDASECSNAFMDISDPALAHVGVCV
jgi:hypothetical protein